MKKYQNYNHYKLPITINPLEYGKLILKIDNIYIINITPKTITVITQFEEFNEVKFFREGDLAFTYKDHKINENTFIRSLANKKFTFKNNELIQTVNTIIRLIILIFLIYIISFLISPENIGELATIGLSTANIIKLRKVSPKYN
jgi:hypothetical protein